MTEFKKRVEPKKIKLPPLVDRSNLYDTLSFDSDTLSVESDSSQKIKDENYNENNSQGVSELESL